MMGQTSRMGFVHQLLQPALLRRLLRTTLLRHLHNENQVGIVTDECIIVLVKKLYIKVNILIFKNVTEQYDGKSLNDSVIYELDVNNNIVAVNQLWQSFALENNAPELSHDYVIGKPLMQYISGNVTKRFWETFLEKVRLSNAVIHLNYRCDSPDLRRFMQIKAYRDACDGLHFESTLLRTEPKPASIYFKRSQQRSADTKVRCSFCNHILYKNHWVEAESLVTGKHSVSLEVNYGICPKCQESLNAL
jgi:hypothetical protein